MTNILNSKYPFFLPELPFDSAKLEPFISAETFSFHHGKHHNAYITKLNSLIESGFKQYKEMTLLDIIKSSSKKEGEAAVFNNAAQVYCHDFFWYSLSLPESSSISEKLQKAIDDSFGSKDKMIQELSSAGVGRFGSGWLWLVQDTSTGKLQILTTLNADNPLTMNNLKPILAIDLWEHAYYLDYQNRRVDFISAICNNVLNWNFASSNIV